MEMLRDSQEKVILFISLCIFLCFPYFFFNFSINSFAPTKNKRCGRLPATRPRKLLSPGARFPHARLSPPRMDGPWPLESSIAQSLAVQKRGSGAPARKSQLGSTLPSSGPTKAPLEQD